MISTLELLLKFFELTRCSAMPYHVNLHLLTHFDLQIVTHQVTSAGLKK